LKRGSKQNVLHLKKKNSSMEKKKKWSPTKKGVKPPG
jgi:hypothetical protein